MESRINFCVAVAVFIIVTEIASCHFVFEVQHKFAGKGKNLAHFKSHDTRRHSRMLASVDLPLGGDSRVDSVGLYFTKIKLGTPPKEYHVQVDTGSDILWINCSPCPKCPSKTNLGFSLSLYDVNASSTSKKVGCDDDFCSFISNSDSCQPDLGCSYHIVYADQSTSEGNFIRDNLSLDQVTGNLLTGPLGQEVVFGCGSDQSGQLGKSESAVDGVMGFGQANTSVLSQLAAAGDAKRVFSHCLDNVKGGGIFAIGVVDSPADKTTPMVPNQMHYNVMLMEMDVDGASLDLPPSIVRKGGTIIDSGTTLAYLPQALYDSLIETITSRQPVKLHIVEETFQCFTFTKDVNQAFPPVNFHFEDSLKLTVYPHDYLFSLESEMYCFGWQVGGMTTEDRSEVILLGDMVLSNKLVVYDLENEVIGWTDHNCSSSIKVKDGSGGVYSVGADNLSSAPPLLLIGKLLAILSTFVAVAFT
ncbi:PREDICTED: aspartic proteinase-like protein 2 isoform X1 [Brassica oleracea var. oleracea]|uniref:Peptidase A1 domain-containing protein n=1 Tax=Brassica oleracea var. oleracea TaxID=109376 RepID=A0A0D3BH39_BRAOL|nr:PREDICTED: aspartic proteinase-like protein 2 isoform X1 [Brassica oleracea var. oleracea]